MWRSWPDLPAAARIHDALRGSVHPAQHVEGRIAVKEAVSLSMNEGPRRSRGGRTCSSNACCAGNFRCLVSEDRHNPLPHIGPSATALN
jgi:hypothetical protein